MKRLFAFSLLLIAACAWSDNPVPGGGNKAASPQQQPTKSNNATAENHDIHVPRVLVIPDGSKAVKVDSPNNKTESAKPENNCCEKTPFIRWLTAEEWNTIFTFCLVAIGTITGFILCWQAFLLRGQIRLGREEFIASHRPKIIVRSFQIVDRDLPVGKEANFIFVAQNIGDTTAKIIKLCNGTFVQSAKISTMPSDLTFPFQEQLIPDLSLKSGQNELFPGNGGSKIEGDESMNIYAGEMALYCMGTITYDDAIGTRRETGFCRRYYPRENRWEVVDSEYEYAY